MLTSLGKFEGLRGPDFGGQMSPSGIKSRTLPEVGGEQAKFDCIQYNNFVLSVDSK